MVQKNNLPPWEDQLNPNSTYSGAFLTEEGAKAATERAGEEYRIEKTTLYKYDPNDPDIRVALESGEVKVVELQEKKSKIIIVQGTYGNSKYSQLKGIVNSNYPHGPYTINGKPDGSVEVRNQKLNSPVYKTYTYAGGTGELLNFKIKSDFTRTQVSTVSGENISPIKKAEQTIINCQGNNLKLDEKGVFYVVHSGLGGTEQEYSTRLNIDTPWESLDPRYKTRFFINNESLMEALEAEANNIPTYSSVEEAQEELADTIQITSDEWLEYIRQLNSQINLGKQGVTLDNNQQDVWDIKHTLNRLPPYMAKRKVRIKGWLYCEKYAKDKQKDAIVRAKQGYDYLKETYGSIITEVSSEYFPTIDGQDFTVDANLPARGITKVFVNGEIIVLVPVPGYRALGSTGISDLLRMNKSTMVETINDSVEADATIIGDPNLTEGINVRINGVDPYSGVYYIKGVTHNISSNGYTCEVTFQSNEVTISQGTVTVNNDLVNFYKKINGFVQEHMDEIKQKIDEDGRSRAVTQELIEAQGPYKEGKSVVIQYDKQQGEFTQVTLDKPISSIPNYPTVDATSDYNNQ